MKILVVAAHEPMLDRASGDLRFFELLKQLAQEHRVFFCAYRKVHRLSYIDTSPYKAALEQSGIIVTERNPIEAIRSERFDAILFEFYFSAKSYIDDARFWQPAARVLIDSVDVHFNRLLAKARLTESDKDYTSARKMKDRELAAYSKADVVIAVSEEDRGVLQRELKNLPVEVIPNIHAVPPLVASKDRNRNLLLFIGNFHHDPNVDAMLYFCSDILPLIRQDASDVRLTIVGDAPPEAVQRFAGENVKVLGFVPDTIPLLEASDISVAPLRYGGGLKGKIGEAMACGLPVVTTSVGTEGFGLSPGTNVLVGDTPEAFAKAVVELIRDRELYENVRKAAWTFVNERYSVTAASRRIQELFGHLDRYPVKKLTPVKILGMTIQHNLDRYVSWRVKQSRR